LPEFEKNWTLNFTTCFFGWIPHAFFFGGFPAQFWSASDSLSVCFKVFGFAILLAIWIFGILFSKELELWGSKKKPPKSPGETLKTANLT